MSSPTRLLLAVRQFHPDYSGAARRFKGYAEGLRARGVEMEVLATGVTDARRGAWLPSVEVDGIKVYRVNAPPGWPGPITTHAAATLRRCFGAPPDVVQLAMAEWALTPWLWGLRGLGVPLAVAQTLMDTPSPHRLKRALQRRLWRLPFRAADAVVVNSAAMAGALRGLGVAAQIIPNGVDTQRFRPLDDPRQRGALRARLGLPDDGPLILNVGAVQRRKAQDLALESLIALAARQPRARLVLVGPDAVEPPFTARLRARAAAAGVADRLHLLGMRDDTPDLLRAADVFLFTSAKEGLPNAVLEAQASALPVITATFLGLSEELGQPQAHLCVKPRQADALADALHGALSQPTLAAEMGQRARAWVQERISLEGALDAYAGLYHRLAGRG
ncbi:glycosyltransferase family 4 protein [Myxococcota bacterium]|nr:glycosyltransferase family 4 protein [Myxococcota bacterium]MBU1431283.1 glycosyltransferase family 4 protein [Myxococcota bacterium]MBU1900453.1 glycosyltransferase family 4 protein [Myxococcota bacterium]